MPTPWQSTQCATPTPSSNQHGRDTGWNNCCLIRLIKTSKGQVRTRAGQSNFLQNESKFLHRAYNFQDLLLVLSRVKDNNLTYSTTQCSPSRRPPLKYSLVMQLRQHWWWPPRASTIGWRPKRVTASVTIWYPRPQTTNETDGFFWNIPSGFGKNLLSKPDIDIRTAPTTDLGNSQSDVS